MAGLPPDEVAYQKSHLYEDSTHRLSAFFIICVVVSFLCMMARATSRRISRLALKADDYTFLIGTALAEGSFVVLLLYAYAANLGKHWLALTPGQMALFPKLNYAYNILNVSCYPPIKISILLLYQRIFIIRLFQRVTWFCIAFVAMIWVSNTLVAIFACTPVRGFYDSGVPAKCINTVQFYWASAVLNVITDFLILVLPMPVVWKLHMSSTRKLGVSLLFVAGGLTFIVSIIRIVYYLRFNAYDPSYSFIGDAYATAGEVCLAIICACAPTWRPLALRIFDLARHVLGRGSTAASGSYSNMERKGGSAGIYPRASGAINVETSIHQWQHNGDSQTQLTDGSVGIEMPGAARKNGPPGLEAGLGNGYGIYDARTQGTHNVTAEVYSN